ncbi:Hsp70 family protein [Marinobacterium sp. D7]|uniref:Hsp70 family protein n=1 Tax=Marinobacterium ramblicola TaxID=2849041 RepID=UPI001C2CC7A4|nr:Hsp70 family protein [Marinobacterium ramblicola]MBV1788100.1 Hsp70 family protein [Marinobacterium ramblicola]
MSRDNASLGEFSLNGLPPAPRGIPKIDVTFDIDASGILNVTALDQATKRSRSIRISGSTRLSESDKQRMIDEAKRFAEADAKRRADADQLNAADTLCYQAEKLLAVAGDKLATDTRDNVKAALQQTREAVEKKDAQLADERRETLQKLVSDAATQLYQQGQPGPQRRPHPTPDTSDAGGDAKPTGAGPGGRVVDADYKESE